MKIVNRIIDDDMIIKMVRMAFSVKLIENGLCVLGAGMSDVPLTIEPLWEIHDMIRQMAGWSDDPSPAEIDLYNATLSKYIGKLSPGAIPSEYAQEFFSELRSVIKTI